MNLLIAGVAILLVGLGIGFFSGMWVAKIKVPVKENPYSKYKDPITGLYKRPSKAGE